MPDSRTLNLANPQVHPAADLFPMLEDEALQDLAEDIKANGLREAIVVDKDGLLIDGRNRLKACQIAGVEPTFQTFEGDPVAYIYSANVARRHMTKGQRAMAIAMLYPEAKRGRGNKDDTLKGAETASFSFRRLKEARLVLRLAPDLAELVLRDDMRLDGALEEAKRRAQLATSVEARMQRLKQGAPDLADLVAEERMTLNEALSAWETRKAEERRQEEVRRGQRQSATTNLRRTLMFLYPHGHEENRSAAVNRAVSWLQELDRGFWPAGTGVDLNSQTLQACIETLEALRDGIIAENVNG